jgi:hypothetical protein
MLLSSLKWVLCSEGTHWFWEQHLLCASLLFAVGEPRCPRNVKLTGGGSWPTSDRSFRVLVR